MPGDPFTFLSGIDGEVVVSFSDEEIMKYKQHYGMDQPLMKQYTNYLANLAKGNLGYSIYYKQPVLELVLSKMVWTASIVLIALSLSFIIGTIIGCYSAWHYDQWWDRLLYGAMITISEVPAFIIGLLFLFFVAARSDVIPMAGGSKVFADYKNIWEQLMDLGLHALLPILTLMMVRLGDFYLIARNSMVAVVNRPYMQTARAKGLERKTILFKHALKNAMLPIVTKLYLSLSSIFSASVLVEVVFNYPGVGRLIREAVVCRDYVLILGIFLIITVFVLIMNYMADRFYMLLDPRIREV
jgi:peptide/nickel transport system permease protein